MADDSSATGNGMTGETEIAADCHVARVTIRNRKGLHARASAKFVKCAETFDADVLVLREGQSVGGTSIMGLMMLAAGPGSVLSIRAGGPDAEAALAALVALVEDGFGEDCVDD
jgi:phosphocarrier protein HPr